MRLVWVLLAVLLTCAGAQAQQEGHALEPSIGFGFSSPADGADNDIIGDGFLARVEYSLGASPFLAWKPYVGLLRATSDPDDPDPHCKRAAIECESTAHVVLLGSKLRVAVPIPWIAPFVELGLGLAAGASRTQTAEEKRRVTGVSFTLPFALGVALGPQHNVELAIVLYGHYAAQQALGGFTAGLRIPLGEAKQ